jgi:hypothetical protein
VDPAIDAPAPPRRDFMLRAHEREHLDALGLRWETVKHETTKWLFIEQYPVPAGYGTAEKPTKQVRIALRIPPDYPTTQIDMMFVDPPLALASGRTIGAVTMQPVAGISFQQWSRHRTGANPWREEEDGVDTHLMLMDYWFRSEAEK